jgi:hypothetical protein
LNCFLSPLSTQNKVEPIFFPLLWEFLFSIRPKEPHFAEAPRGTPSAGAFPLHTSPSARASITYFVGVLFEYFCKRTATWYLAHALRALASPNEKKKGVFAFSAKGAWSKAGLLKNK